MTTEEYERLPVLKIKNKDEWGWGTVNVEGFEVRANSKQGSLEVFVESGYAVCMTGESYSHPMSAKSDFGREEIFVNAGQTMDWLTKTTKEILSHPKTVRVRVE